MARRRPIQEQELRSVLTGPESSAEGHGGKDGAWSTLTSNRALQGLTGPVAGKQGLTVVNGKEGPRVLAKIADLAGKLSDDTGGAQALRGAVADNKGRIPADEALYVAADEREAGTRNQRCGGCAHFLRDGNRFAGKCKAVHPVGQPGRRLEVKYGGYCMLWQPKLTKSEAVPVIPIERLLPPEPRIIRKPAVPITDLVKAGPFIGPRGGKWADAKHTVPWEGEHKKALFHSAPAHAVESIQEHGLKPRKGAGLFSHGAYGAHSQGKVFLSEHFTAAKDWHEKVKDQLFDQHDDESKHDAVMLRVKHRKTSVDEVGDKDVEGSRYTKRSIPPEHIEYHDKEHGWRPISHWEPGRHSVPKGEKAALHAGKEAHRITEQRKVAEKRAAEAREGAKRADAERIKRQGDEAKKLTAEWGSKSPEEREAKAKQLATKGPIPGFIMPQWKIALRHDGQKHLSDAEVAKLREAHGLVKSLRKAGPFIGPRGGKWADAKHTIPWEEDKGGKKHEIQFHEALPFQGKPTYHETDAGNGMVRMSAHGPGSYGPTMPKESVKHFVNDLAGKVDLPKHPSNADINAVIEGKAKLLGKGDDGLAFKVGDKVVKVSTTVPFQPDNPGHRTPEQAKQMIRTQVIIGNKLADKVPGIQRSTFVEHGDKGFQIKPYVDIPEKFSLAQLDKVQDTLIAMHQAGYALNDEVQVGLDDKGEPVMFDVGKAAPIPPEDAKAKGIFKDSSVEDDMRRLKRLYEDHGHADKFVRKDVDEGQQAWDRVQASLKKWSASPALRKLGRRQATSAAEKRKDIARRKLSGKDLDNELTAIDFELEDLLDNELKDTEKSMVRITDLAKAGRGAPKYKSRKRVKGRWVYEYEKPAKQAKGPSITQANDEWRTAMTMIEEQGHNAAAREVIEWSIKHAAQRRRDAIKASVDNPASRNHMYAKIDREETAALGKLEATPVMDRTEAARSLVDGMYPDDGPLKAGMSVEEAEAAIRSAKVEHLAIYDAEGKQLMRLTSGHPRMVEIPPEAIRVIKATPGGCIFTHNHPSNGSLSAEDVAMAINADAKEMRAIGSLGAQFSLKRPAQGWGVDNPLKAQKLGLELQFAYEAAVAKARGRMDNHLREHGGTPGDATHPAFSQEQFNEFISQETFQAYNKVGAKYGWAIERSQARSAESRRDGAARDKARRKPGRAVRRGAKQAPEEQLTLDFGKAVEWRGASKFIGRKGKLYAYYCQDNGVEHVDEDEHNRRQNGELRHPGMRKASVAQQIPLVAPIGGASPAKTPELPDFHDLYFQPESMQRMKGEFEAGVRRRRSMATWFQGRLGFHGGLPEDEPEIRYEPNTALSNIDTIDPNRPGKRPPRMTTIGELKRLAAGTTTHEADEDDEDEDEEDNKRKRRKKRRGR